MKIILLGFVAIALFLVGPVWFILLLRAEERERKKRKQKKKLAKLVKS